MLMLNAKKSEDFVLGAVDMSKNLSNKMHAIFKCRRSTRDKGVLYHGSLTRATLYQLNPL